MANVNPSRRHTIMQRLIERDGPNCWICGNLPAPKKSGKKNRASVDHVIEKCRGGTNALNNLRIACQDCNSNRSQNGRNSLFIFGEYKGPIEWTKDNGR